MKKRQDTSITLTFDLNRRIDDGRIEEVVVPHPGRFTHHVIIEKESDLDQEVREWLRKAYELIRF